MKELFVAMFPEIVLCITAGALFLIGVSDKASSRRLAPILAVVALLIAGLSQLTVIGGNAQVVDKWRTVQIFEFARFIKILSAGMGILLVMLAWPSDSEATGNSALHFGTEAGEFFGLMLLSVAGIFIVAGANDIMLLFLGIELASIPTYIMVSISRPLPVAQEAGVKYFFLGAMAAAIMLFGFSYLYGITGTTKLDEMLKIYDGAMRGSSVPQPWLALTPWTTLAVVMLIAGFAFKMAAVPLHVYAGDVYQGAATPVTAFLSFVPKISGFVALLKILFVISGGHWQVDHRIVKLLWVIAVLTMTFGNTLGLLQFNIKRVFAYSSIAHTGYMLVGVTALVATDNPAYQTAALQGVLFYLTAYGLMNVGAFGSLILLPSRGNQPATSAETFEDIAGKSKTHMGLSLAMAVSCFGLIGLPTTIGFWGKFFLILPAWNAGLTWLVVILVINAAISAAYYLKIVAALFLRPEPVVSRSIGTSVPETPMRRPFPVLVSISVSMAAVLGLGIILPATQRISERAATASKMRDDSPMANNGTDADAGYVPAVSIAIGK
jgi:NADH-quinone oxidoreductase subunit N